MYTYCIDTILFIVSYDICIFPFHKLTDKEEGSEDQSKYTLICHSPLIVCDFSFFHWHIEIHTVSKTHAVHNKQWSVPSSVW